MVSLEINRAESTNSYPRRYMLNKEIYCRAEVFKELARGSSLP